MIANVAITISVTKQNRRINFSSLSYYQDMKAIGRSRRAPFLTSRRRGIIGGQQIDPVQLLIDGHGPRPHFGGDRIHGIVLAVDQLDDGHVTLAIGAEGEAESRIETRRLRGR